MQLLQTAARGRGCRGGRGGGTAPHPQTPSADHRDASPLAPAAGRSRGPRAAPDPPAGRGGSAGPCPGGDPRGPRTAGAAQAAAATARGLTRVQALGDGGGVDEVPGAQAAHDVLVQLLHLHLHLLLRERATVTRPPPAGLWHPAPLGPAAPGSRPPQQPLPAPRTAGTPGALGQVPHGQHGRGNTGLGAAPTQRGWRDSPGRCKGTCLLGQPPRARPHPAPQLTHGLAAQSGAATVTGWGDGAGGWGWRLGPTPLLLRGPAPAGMGPPCTDSPAELPCPTQPHRARPSPTRPHRAEPS